MAAHVDLEQPGDAGLVGARTQLHGDHQRILGHLQQLADIASTLPIGVLKLRITDSLDALREHERTESHLIDIGSHR
jgi:hypothetical protein